MKRTATVSLLVLMTALGALRAPAADTIVFGAAVSLTGKTAKEGEYTRDGYNFLVDKLNEMGGITVGGKKYKVSVTYYDDESKSERTAQLIEKLINEDKVSFILGPYGSAPSGTAAPICEKYRIPMIEANGSAESIFSKGYKYTFAVLSPARLYLKGVVDLVLAKDKTARTVAVLGENEPFSKEVAAGAADYAREKGLQVVYRELYPTGTQDVSALLTNIKAKNPDLILGAGHLQDSLLIVKQARDLGVSPKAMGFSVGPSSPEFRDNLKGSADYVFGATQWTEALKYNGDDPWKTPRAYAVAFRAKYPKYRDIPYQVAESSAAALAFWRAIEKANSLDPVKVRDAIAALDMMTFYGQVKFDSRGINVTKPMAVEQLQPDGRKYTVFPPSVAEKDAIYPMVPWDKRK
jgi:branched-chain amino acid transport system substrate-binding protein